jgi:hypothetical protein
MEVQVCMFHFLGRYLIDLIIVPFVVIQTLERQLGFEKVNLERHQKWTEAMLILTQHGYHAAAEQIRNHFPSELRKGE